MKQRLLDVFFKLLRFVVCDGAPLTEEDVDFARENLADLYRLSKAHDLAHLVCHAALEQKLVDQSSEYFKKLEKEKLLAIFRYEKLSYELGELCTLLEDAKIRFMPLKGSLLRRYYPEPWMRTSCDIDVLVHQEDLDSAVDCLEKGGYEKEGLASHDVSLKSAGGVHIELHYLLVEEGMVNSSAEILDDVWKDSHPVDGYEYFTAMSDEMFYFYHIAHMAKHFLHGGCGIRPIVDLWLLENKAGYDIGKCDGLLAKGGLGRFAEAVRCFCNYRLSDGAADPETLKMEEFLVTGGVYGTTENKISVTRTQKTGKLAYVLSRIVIPYDSLRYLYPIIVRRPWLTPIMQVRRWFAIVFSGRTGKALREFSANNSISQERVDQMSEFLNELELK